MDWEIQPLHNVHFPKSRNLSKLNKKRNCRTLFQFIEWYGRTTSILWFFFLCFCSENPQVTFEIPLTKSIIYFQFRHYSVAIHNGLSQIFNAKIRTYTRKIWYFLQENFHKRFTFFLMIHHFKIYDQSPNLEL